MYCPLVEFGDVMFGVFCVRMHTYIHIHIQTYRAAKHPTDAGD